MDTGTSERGPAYSPNLVLRDLRASRGWGRPRLARELDNHCTRKDWPSPGQANIEKQLYRLESGRVRRPDEFYARLLSDFFGRTSHELFGELDPGNGEIGSTYDIRSHQFVPSYIGADAARNLVAATPHIESAGQWTGCVRVESSEHPHLYVWPCGVVVFHVVDQLTPASIAEVAVWRRPSYVRNLEAAAASLATYGCPSLSEPYVLSAYWVDTIPLDSTQATCALRLLAIPRVLTSRETAGTPSELHRATLIEQSLLREGFDHPEIVDFGVRGISSAYASWSGVVYHPTATERALTEDELVACELSVQAAWTYSDYIRDEVEAGRDPVVAESCGWRYLRGVKSRLTTERPQETSQHRAMREAVVSTSGLERRLDQALEALRECERG
jgi:hypothetical protein